MSYVVVIYVDDAKWMELPVEEDKLDQDPKEAAHAIMDGWLRETAHDDWPYDPNWRSETECRDDGEDWRMVGFYGDENNACYTAIFSPYRGERVTFVFFT